MEEDSTRRKEGPALPDRRTHLCAHRGRGQDGALRTAGAGSLQRQQESLLCLVCSVWDAGQGSLFSAVSEDR